MLYINWRYNVDIKDHQRGCIGVESAQSGGTIGW